MKPKRPSVLILWALLLVLFIASIGRCAGQDPTWRAFVSYKSEFLIHTSNGWMNNIEVHRDNRWQLGATKNHWMIAYYKQGHNNYFFYHNPKTKTGKSNRNNSGLYFRHPIPWLSKLSPSVLISVGHRIKIMGDPIGEKGTIFEYYMPEINLSYCLGKTKKINRDKGLPKMEYFIEATLTNRYRCMSPSLGGYIKF